MGGGDALSPCIPDAQQTRLPGGSPKPPVLRGTGIVDGVVRLEEPAEAHKPGHRSQASTKVSKVSIGWGTVTDDQHGILARQQRGELHGPLARRKRRGDLYGPPAHEADPLGLPKQKQVFITHKAKFACTMILLWITLGLVQSTPHQLRTKIRRDPTVASPRRPQPQHGEYTLHRACPMRPRLQTIYFTQKPGLCQTSHDIW